MAVPYDHKALWLKAKLFINRAMDDDGYRSFDEQALWAALALEVLAKAALARVSPLLVAEPTEDGTNLLIACGLMEGDARFTSVKAKTLFTRCQKAFKPFSSVEAAKITSARNEYLHSSGPGFTAIPPDAWWPRFWAQASILVTALDRDLSEFVGIRREGVVSNHLDQNAKNVEHRTEALIERAKQRLAQHLGGSLPAKVAAEWKQGADLSPGFRHRCAEICPACNSEGRLEGEDVQDTETEYVRISEHDVDVIVTLTVGADYFSCSTCRLVLDGYELIEQAGLSTTFNVEGDAEDVYAESEYGND
jgi:hypothetical protein